MVRPLDLILAFLAFAGFVLLILVADSGHVRAQVRDQAIAEELLRNVEPQGRRGCAAFIAGQPQPAFPGPSTGPMGPKGFRKPSIEQMRQVYAHSGWLTCRHRALWIAGGRSANPGNDLVVTCTASSYGLSVTVRCR